MRCLVSILLISSFLIASNSINQETIYVDLQTNVNKCGTPSPNIDTFIPHSFIDSWLENNPDYNNRDNLEIPIAFHVIYVNSTSNGGYLAESTINEQISVLNEAFSNHNISFILTSIDYTQNSDWYYDDDEDLYKAELSISPLTTLNIYTTSASEYLGYAYLPNQWPENSYMHGVVLNPTSLPGGLWPYDEGDTAVHEVGHYLGLYHTFEGGCFGSGDAVGDTPDQDDGDNIYQCSTMDTCTSAGNDPIHNYMNYTDDDCITNFTNGQVTRMDYMIDVYKSNLGCWDGYDCASECGGNAEIDECGICAGNNECLNNAPIAIDAEYSLDEDNQINIYLSATDEEGDALTFSIINVPNGGILQLEGVSATYMPDINYNGYDSFTFVASDGEFNSNIATISLIINPINDAPYLLDIPDAEVESSSVFTYEFQAVDVDGDDLTYTVTAFGSATATLSGNMLLVTSEYGNNEVAVITVTVTDGVAIDSTLFNLIIFTFGCTAFDCCNYNPYANVDDGSCIYPEENYDCYGNCIVDIDCAGVCGGNLEFDCCGSCGGDNSTCDTCCGLPFNDDCTSDCYEDPNTGECCPSWEVDECGVCLGNGIVIGECDCAGNVEDCAGTCGGETQFDECGVCGGDNTSCEIIGDLNGSGTINVSDIILLVNIILNSNDFNPLADLNQDGINNIIDIVMLVDLILNPE